MPSSPSENPYRPPTATVGGLPLHKADARFAAPALKVGAGRGAGWVSDGWTLFKVAPLMWVAAMLLMMAMSGAISAVPGVGQLLSMLFTPVMMAGLLDFSHGVAREGRADINRLFTGLRGDKLGKLMVLSVLYLLMILGILLITGILVALLLGSASLLSGAGSGHALQALIASKGWITLALVLLVAFFLLMIAGAATWYAPGLVMYADLDASEALKESFAASLRNWLPMFIYGIMAFLVVLLGALALIVGLLVAFPVLMASYYASFCDMFERS